MGKRLAGLVFLACAVSLRAQSGAPSAAANALTAQPGDIVRVEGTATAFGKSWNGLIGIDLDTKPGTYAITVDGQPQSLRVRPKQFAVRRLRVPGGFVNPPPEALEQIVRDSKMLSEIFATVTPRRWTGPFVLPVNGKPTSNFGTRSYYNGERRSPHAGVDFLSATGTPIRASNAGSVALAEPLYFTGNTVIIDYGDGLYSLFAHLSEFLVSTGDTVAPDTVVGRVGATGRVTGPHLHWTVRLQGARVDPASLLTATKTLNGL
jgi:murein DD-endopeptidase MepM/ murein hydrolase activator NlpD